MPFCGITMYRVVPLTRSNTKICFWPNNNRTRYTVAKLVEMADAKSTVKCVLHEIYTRFWVPTNIHSNRGTPLWRYKLKQLYNGLGVEKEFQMVSPPIKWNFRKIWLNMMMKLHQYVNEGISRLCQLHKLFSVLLHCRKSIFFPIQCTAWICSPTTFGHGPPINGCRRGRFEKILKLWIKIRKTKIRFLV